MGFLSDRQSRDRDGRGLRFRFGLRVGYRAGGDLDEAGPSLAGVLGTGLTAASGSEGPRATAGTTVAIVDRRLVGLGGTGSASRDHPDQGGADATEPVRSSLLSDWRTDGGVDDDVV